MIDNKWRGGKMPADLKGFPIELMDTEGILLLPVYCETENTDEILLIWIDRTDFIYEISKQRPFNLFLKSGLFRSQNGYLIWLLFYVASHISDVEPVSSIDIHINVFDKFIMKNIQKLGVQKYWHLILMGAENKIVNQFELENNYNITETLKTALSLTKELPFYDFIATKIDFMNKYSLNELHKMNNFL